MKYVLYESKSEQSYTLLKKSQDPKGIVEADAVIIHEITAKNWDDALEKQDELLYEGHNTPPAPEPEPDEIEAPALVPYLGDS